jgi:hypothetical protein
VVWFLLTGIIYLEVVEILFRQDSEALEYLCS